MALRVAPLLWGVALAALIALWPGSARCAQVIPPGREAAVLGLVQRAFEATHEEPNDGRPQYDVRIDHDVLRLMLGEPANVEFAVQYEPHADGELAPGVVLRCGAKACGDPEQARWRSLAAALARERDQARDSIWVEVHPATDDAAATQGSHPATRALWIALGLFGLCWLALHVFRCLTAMNWRGRRTEILVCGALCVVSAAVALGVTAHLPVHEHNSYLARSDCAWMLDCTRDPAAPGWVPGFFRVYGPLLHAFPYSVENLCRFTLVMSLAAALLGRYWLTRTLVQAGWAPERARRAGSWALALICLNPLWIRVAAAGTPWPYVLVCLFGAGLAASEAIAGAGLRKYIAGVAACSLLTLAANSNLVMLTALPLVWLGPAMLREGKRWWLPSPWLVAAGMAVLALSLESTTIFRTALSNNAHTGAVLRAYHVFFDARFLPPTLGLLLLLGLFIAARRRSPLWALAYLALATHPTLTNYAGSVLGPNYPVSLVNAFIGETFAGLFAGVGAVWLLCKAADRGRQRLAHALLGVALLLPMPFARESWRFLSGSRVAERELSAISRALPTLPPHQQLVIPTRIQPMLGGAEPGGDPLELQFPVGEYLASQRRLGRSPPLPLSLDAMERNDTPTLDAPGTLVYVGVSQRSFFPTEAKFVPDDLRRTELETLYQRFDLVPVATFELTPEQHEAIPWRLGAGRVAKLELGFYWLKPKVRKAPKAH